jgi:hypothetical protein
MLDYFLPFDFAYPMNFLISALSCDTSALPVSYTSISFSFPLVDSYPMYQALSAMIFPCDILSCASNVTLLEHGEKLWLVPPALKTYLSHIPGRLHVYQ